MASSARADGSTAVAKGADNLLLLTPKRPTRGGLPETPGSSKTTPGKSSPPKTFRRANAMSPSSFAGKMPPATPTKATVKSAMKVSPLSMKASPMTKNSSPKDVKSPGHAMKSPKKAVPVSKGSKGSAMKSKTKKLAMKSMGSMKCAMKSSSSSSKAPSKAKVKKTVIKIKGSAPVMKSAKGANTRKKPAMNVKVQQDSGSDVTITVSDPGMIMVERHHDARDAEGKTKFWSKDSPDELHDFLSKCYPEWVEVYDWNTSYVIEGTHITADPWPVWARNELERHNWNFMERKGNRERWEKNQ